MAPKSDLSSVRTQRPGNDCDEGRLPRPVLAEQDVHLAPSQIEIDLVQGENPGKPTADPGQLQESRLLFREGAGARGRPLNRFRQGRDDSVHGERRLESVRSKRRGAIERLDVLGVDHVERRTDVFLVGLALQDPDGLIDGHPALHDR